ncbi:MAG: arginine decarboxylase [Flavobacteriales bacterium]|nr:arginine decarboxylase [Flavobacteriales bacterium]|tara:strand:+ start:3115 stop:3321 length:207 start_codon:yes stop_codon:yes gene_type:complete
MKSSAYIIILFSITSCATLPEYKKVFVNENEMQTGLSDIENFSNNSKTYREGSQGANGGKSGGGCGCN